MKKPQIIETDCTFSRASFFDVTTLSAFDYTNDNSGRRTGREDSGTAFVSTQANTFTYNAKSEVTGSTMRNGNSTYSFDQIGNRTNFLLSIPGDPDPVVIEDKDFTPNALNQYTDIEGNEPVYDDDGNLTDDDEGKTFTWNGENRMIISTIGTTTVENTYDSQGRRVQKVVKLSGMIQKDIRYLYDGWNLLYEIDLESTDPTRYFIWGLDLSQSLQGAGGVGGLLFTTSGTDVHAVSYDANGNISEYIDLSDGSVDAHMEYDAFGRTITNTFGAPPASFGFSTKYQDEETGYYYYGFRYYDPETGRWPNRDPMGEWGGVNLYSFVRNDGINLIDIFGFLGVGGWADRAAAQSLEAGTRALEGAASFAGKVGTGIISVIVYAPPVGSGDYIDYPIVIDPPVPPAPDPVVPPLPDTDTDTDTDPGPGESPGPDDDCPTKRCLPCDPPVGQVVHEIVPAGDRERGRHSQEGHNNGHVKHWVVRQTAYPECKCVYNKNKPFTLENTQTPIPNSIPRSKPFTLPTGGGPVL